MARNYKNPRYWAQQIIKGRQQYHHAGQANNQPRSRG
jgi:hypothetical protein